MRSVNKSTHPVSRWALALSLVAAMGGCGRGMDSAANLSSANGGGIAASGPAGDYPVVLGEPYVVDGTRYTPVDTVSYDEVGYAAADASGGAGVTAAHKTLPLPSYIEITSLVTGKTILARVERRGPMTGDRLVSLAPAALAQLDIQDGAPVRVRRVNPPEEDRAKLRMGGAASGRMETPQSLVAVLKRKLPGRGSADLALPAAPGAEQSGPIAIALPPSTPAPPQQQPTPDDGRESGSGVPALQNSAHHNPAREQTGRHAAELATLDTPGGAPKPAASAGTFFVQAATFSNQPSAQQIAVELGGFVQPSGKYFRVRLGPFTSRGQADAALAKVRAAGYSDARISITD